MKRRMLTEEEKQKIIEEEKLREKLAEEKKKKEAKNALWGVFWIIVFGLVIMWMITDWQNKDMKEHPEKYMTYEQGYIIIQPIK